MEVSLILFFIGFIILVTGARLLVKGAISIARILKISTWVIGIAIVGIGTSIPELSISISSTLVGNNVGLGAIIGGNTFNLLMILGLVAFFSPVYIRREWYKDILINIAAVVIAILVILFPVSGGSFLGITRVEGGMLLFLFIVWFIFMLRREVVEDDGIDYKIFTAFTSSIMIAVGILGVFIGGEWVVAGAEDLALFFSVSPTVIGLTIVGIGTSLPELVVSLVALLNGHKGIAVGNIIGSNVFGFLGILGITGLIKPLPVLEGIQSDAFVAVFASIVVAVLILFIGKRGMLSRAEGVFLVLAYIAYIFFILTSM
ncbi:MAG TPA: sodium:calcium antiporter [Candidatus Kaiserbacteria bacterium]|nr:sodium:calcium antiporter [Candidatus Kaiserbacteria bacterium]